MTINLFNFKDNTVECIERGIFNNLNSSMYVSSNITTDNFANMRGNVILNNVKWVFLI